MSIAALPPKRRGNNLLDAPAHSRVPWFRQAGSWILVALLWASLVHGIPCWANGERVATNSHEAKLCGVFLGPLENIPVCDFPENVNSGSRHPLVAADTETHRPDSRGYRSSGGDSLTSGEQFRHGLIYQRPGFLVPSPYSIGHLRVALDLFIQEFGRHLFPFSLGLTLDSIEVANLFSPIASCQHSHGTYVYGWRLASVPNGNGYVLKREGISILALRPSDCSELGNAHPWPLVQMGRVNTGIQRLVPLSKSLSERFLTLLSCRIESRPISSSIAFSAWSLRERLESIAALALSIPPVIALVISETCLSWSITCFTKNPTFTRVSRTIAPVSTTFNLSEIRVWLHLFLKLLDGFFFLLASAAVFMDLSISCGYAALAISAADGLSPGGLSPRFWSCSSLPSSSISA